jgi:hypothetical protein
VTTTCAPNALSASCFSFDILSGIVNTQRYPFTAAHIATATPVLPLVFSTIVPPRRRSPSRSALSRMWTTMRSLMEPPGFMYSSFTRTVASSGPASLCSFTSGVRPIAARTFSW